ncbi:barstar family protein [Streptomyces sp. NPDC048584]|uniref:barstar family protein n=1 Tax=Streptomyces sp. NPDC048584 TaxID=3365573 RepID=UPI0037115C8C
MTGHGQAAHSPGEPPPAPRGARAPRGQPSPPGATTLRGRLDDAYEQGRAAWLDLTTRAWQVPAPRPDHSGGEYHLDGRFVTDVPGLHRAIAEALLGPGRYFGREWNAFKDCLGGGFGVTFTLTWHDSEIARRALADVVEDPEDGLSYFEDIVRLLERRGVTVALR